MSEILAKQITILKNNLTTALQKNGQLESKYELIHDRLVTLEKLVNKKELEDIFELPLIVNKHHKFVKVGSFVQVKNIKFKFYGVVVAFNETKVTILLVFPALSGTLIEVYRNKIHKSLPISLICFIESVVKYNSPRI